MSFLLCSRLVLYAAVVASFEDSDGNGSTDNFERQSLQTFASIFVLSTEECDGVPTEFQPGLQEPRFSAKNGTTYDKYFSPVYAASQDL
jgi:hypothetical protein